MNGVPSKPGAVHLVVSSNEGAANWRSLSACKSNCSKPFNDRAGLLCRV